MPKLKKATRKTLVAAQNDLQSIADLVDNLIQDNEDNDDQDLDSVLDSVNSAINDLETFLEQE